jgi:hypothetical protein
MKTSTLLQLGAAVLAAGVLFLLLRIDPVRPEQPTTVSEPLPAEPRQRDVLEPARAADVNLMPSPALLAKLQSARDLPSIERQRAIVAALAEAAEAEPAAASALAAELGPLEGRDEALHETLGHFLRKEPGEAFAFLHERVSRVNPETALVFAREAARFDTVLALGLAERLPQPLRSTAMSDTFSEWAALDPEAASSRAAQLEDEHDRAAAVGAVARVWAHGDPRSAFAWGGQFDDLETRGAALEPTISIWAETDPAAAARAAAASSPGDHRQRLLDAAVGMWAERDPEAALSFVTAALRDPSEREATATTVLLHLAQTQPEAAAERAAQWAHSSQQGSRSVLLDKVLAMFSASSASDAVAWAHARASDAPLRDAIAASVLERWHEQDARAAEVWRQAHASR